MNRRTLMVGLVNTAAIGAAAVAVTRPEPEPLTRENDPYWVGPTEQARLDEQHPGAWVGYQSCDARCWHSESRVEKHGAKNSGQYHYIPSGWHRTTAQRTPDGAWLFSNMGVGAWAWKRFGPDSPGAPEYAR